MCVFVCFLHHPGVPRKSSVQIYNHNLLINILTILCFTLPKWVMLIVWKMAGILSRPQCVNAMDAHAALSIPILVEYTCILILSLPTDLKRYCWGPLY